MSAEINPLIYVWLGEMIGIIILIFFAAMFFFHESRRHKGVTILSHYYLGIGEFFLCMTLNGIFDILEQHARYVQGLDTLFPPEQQLFPALYPQSLWNNTTFCIIIPILLASFAILSFQLEKNIIQSKHRWRTWMLVVSFCIALLAFIGPYLDGTGQYYMQFVVGWTMAPFTFVILYWGIFYLVFAKRSAGSIRHKAIMTAFGLAFIMGSILFDIVFRLMMETAGLEIFWLMPIAIRAIGLIGVPFLFYGFRQ